MGESVNGPKFYRHLYKDDEFCAEVGRVVLATGRLECALIRYIKEHAPTVNVPKNATLGHLIGVATKNALLSDVFRKGDSLLYDQRNHVVHNIYALLTGQLRKPESDEERRKEQEKPRLPSSDLLDSDVRSYSDYAWQLAKDLDGIADIVLDKLRAQ